MLVKSLLAEFEHEAQNTRRLLGMIPDSALDYKPSVQLVSTYPAPGCIGYGPVYIRQRRYQQGINYS
jgi:hypothetical protein